MDPSSLVTPRLELRPGTAASLRAELEGHAALSAALGVEVPATWPPEYFDADAVRWTLDRLGDRVDGDPWGLYWFILRPDAAPGIEGPVLVGVGGLRGGPGPTGEVEVGYGIVAEHRRRGYATEVVRAWIDFAFRDPRVHAVTAQTLAHLAASIGVMEKAGLAFDGEGSDPHAPEGERVVRYVLPRERWRPPDEPLR